MNILSLESLRNCTSCQFCAAVCPKNAITIKLNRKGFYRPEIDNKLCIDCSLCVNTCYKYDKQVSITETQDLDKTQLFAVSAKDSDLLNNTTSGGVADLLAKELIQQGYHVVGVIYDFETNRAAHRIAVTLDETIGFRGSKYIQPYSFDALNTLLSNIKEQKYAFFGLPCHIYALSKYLQQHKLRDRCVLIDLFCHGCPSMHVWDKTVKMIKKKLKVEQLDKVNFRSKVYGWGRFAIEAKANGKTYFSTPIHNEFYNLFFSNQVLNDSCTDCQLRSTLAYTDIRLGDFWGKKFKNNKKGMSGVSLVTTTGKLLFNSIKEQLVCEAQNYNDFLPYQSWMHTYEINDQKRESIYSLLEDPSISVETVSKKITSERSFITKTKVLIKHILFCYFYKQNR